MENDWVRKVAYKLQLCDNAQIHLVFHVSQLKKYRGDERQVPERLPQVNNEGLISVDPYAILATKLAMKGNVAVVYVLVHGANGEVADATWEPYDVIATRFPQFDFNA
ncbi:hypothetical protein Tco_1480428 [Tanacetum coccineum]